MKKFLLLLCAFACVSSASALTVDEILGEYEGTMSCRQYCVFEYDESSWTNYYVGNFTMTIAMGENENEVIINNIFHSDYDEILPVTATFDPDTKQLLIEPQLVASNYRISNSSAIETDSDGYDVVMTPQPVYAAFDDDNNLILVDWCLAVNESTWDVYAVNGETTYSPVTVGINDIITDSENSSAPVELYNLQGARIDNSSAPAPGLYIRRQGSNVQKIIIR